MISKITSNSQLQKLVVSTGNVLNVNNRLGRKSNEELLDGLHLALTTDNTVSFVELNNREGHVLRASGELNKKLTENQREDISIGAKIFLNKNSTESVHQAVRALLQILQVDNVDNVVLAFHPQASANPIAPGTPASPNTTSEGGFKWSGCSSMDHITELKKLWSTLEEHALRKEIKQLGVCDLDAETLAALHSFATVPPAIAQINLATCCVVPASLQEFCNKHDIQLLTHGDPEILLPSNQFVIPDYEVDWTLRYQIHLRCRGVITAKGYILGASRAPLQDESA